MAATANSTLQTVTQFMTGIDYISVKELVQTASGSFFANFTSIIVRGINDTYPDVILPNDDNLQKYFVNNETGTEPEVIWDATTATVTLGAGTLISCLVF